MLYLLISAIIIYLSYPPIGFSLLGFVSLVPFFHRIFKTDFKIYKVFPFSVFISSFLFSAILHLQNKPLLFKIGAFIVLNILNYIELLILTFFILYYKKNIKISYKLYLLISITWIFFEYISNKLLYGFSFYMFVTQTNNELMISLSKYIGMFGVSFIVVFLNLVFYDLFQQIYKKEKLVKNILIAVSIILIIGVSNFIYINLQNIQDINRKNLRISLIQGNITSEMYEKLDSKEIFEIYYQLSFESVENFKSEIIIWPETAVHKWMTIIPYYKNKLVDFAKKYGANLFIGSPELNSNDDEFNSIFFIDKNGMINGSYRKNFTVPFYEDYFSKNNSINVFELDNFRIGNIICFEALFPDIVNEYNRENIDLLFLHSNNSMFGFSNIAYLISTMVKFQAAENDLPIFQVMNSGVSQIINENGVVIDSTKLFEQKILNIDYPIKKHQINFYVKYKDSIFLLILLFLVSCGIKIKFKKE